MTLNITMNSIAEAQRNVINTNGPQGYLATLGACLELLSKLQLSAIPTIRLTKRSLTTTIAYVARL
jgi:hypothetical protein